MYLLAHAIGDMVQAKSSAGKKKKRIILFTFLSEPFYSASLGAQLHI